MKIVTHNGQFHADEIFAIALLECIYGEANIIRTRNIQPEHYTKDFWLIDVGGIYDERLNFDHHQEEILESSNILVLEYLYAIGEVSDYVYDALYADFMSISHIDRNGYEGMDGFQVNGLIKSLNALTEGFNSALIVAKVFIFSILEKEKSVEKSRNIFDAGEDLGNGLRVCDEFPFYWKSYNEAIFLVAPDKNGKWCLHTTDAKQFPLVQVGGEEFFHNGKFLAVYANKEKAVTAGIVNLQNTFG